MSLTRSYKGTAIKFCIDIDHSAFFYPPNITNLSQQIERLEEISEAFKKTWTWKFHKQASSAAGSFMSASSPPDNFLIAQTLAATTHSIHPTEICKNLHERPFYYFVLIISALKKNKSETVKMFKQTREASGTGLGFPFTASSRSTSGFATDPSRLSSENRVWNSRATKSQVSCSSVGDQKVFSCPCSVQTTNSLYMLSWPRHTQPMLLTQGHLESSHPQVSKHQMHHAKVSTPKGSRDSNNFSYFLKIKG